MEREVEDIEDVSSLGERKESDSLVRLKIISCLISPEKRGAGRFHCLLSYKQRRCYLRRVASLLLNLVIVIERENLCQAS